MILIWVLQCERCFLDTLVVKREAGAEAMGMDTAQQPEETAVESGVLGPVWGLRVTLLLLDSPNFSLLALFDPFFVSHYLARDLVSLRGEVSDIKANGVKN